jgi:hypothetical protein
VMERSLARSMYTRTVYAIAVMSRLKVFTSKGSILSRSLGLIFAYRL